LSSITAMSSGLEARLITLRRALLAFRDTPGRRGRVVHLQDIDDLLVGGDMHGNLENFRRLLQRADLAHQPRRHLVLQEVVHGPFRYPSGGDKSHQLLDLICALKCQFPHQVHFLVGNHELAQATNRAILKNDNDLNGLFLDGVRTAYGNRADEVYSLYLELFALAPLALRSPGRVYVSHSLPSGGQLPGFDPAALEQQPTPPAELAPGGSVYSLVWGRDVREENVQAFLARVDSDVLITGHIPCEKGFERPSPRHVIVDSQGSPAACCLVPAARPVTPADLDGCIHLL
jgi:hypothetical protein